jgi:myo-inositol-1(or 4)-monophosphatase
MNRCEHVVIAKDDGRFYCRVLDCILNCKNDEYVCGKGCPCFVSADGNTFVCSYEDMPGIFPITGNIDIRLQKAYEYSAKAHLGQYRKGTEIPYFSHIITTMNYAMELTDDIEVLQAAVLHDTVEDTDITVDDLIRDFGERVARLVEAETENKRMDMPANQTWEIRKKEGIEHLKDSNIDFKIIVLADKTANAESLVREWRRIGDKVWDKFNQTDKKKQEWYFKSIRDGLYDLGDTSVMKTFDEFIKILFD